MITTKSAEERKRFWELLAETRPAREAMKKATLVKAQIIDIPFAQFEPQPEVRRCSRLCSNGRPCQLPALEGYEDCLRHYRWHLMHQAGYALPLPEDALSLQETMGHTVDLVLTHRISADEARAVAELCRIMEKNLARCQHELDAVAHRR